MSISHWLLKIHEDLRRVLHWYIGCLINGSICFLDHRTIVFVIVIVVVVVVVVVVAADRIRFIIVGIRSIELFCCR